MPTEKWYNMCHMAEKLLKKMTHKVSPRKKCVCVAIMIVCAPICALTVAAGSPIGGVKYIVGADASSPQQEAEARANLEFVRKELLRVKPDGSFTFDESYGWADGWITWDVPFGWNSPEAVDANPKANPFREFDPQAGHRFTITTNGTVTVRKFGNEAVREANEDTSQGGRP